MQTEFALGLNNLLNVGEDLKGFYIGKVVDDGESEPDPMGRIKVKIESLFGDIEDSDLPWIQMMPSCGMYVRPQIGDFVTVVFMGSIYEGFYAGHTVHMKSASKNEDGGVFGANLGKEFFLNFHNTFIKGKYDGSEFELNVNKNTTIKIDDIGNIEITNAKDLVINTDGITAINVGEDAEISVAKDAIIKCDNCEVKASTKALIDGGGSTVEIGASGTTITGGMLILGTNTGAAVPAFCGLPNCLLTGAPHNINMVTA